jgi:hypothetical protein
LNWKEKEFHYPEKFENLRRLKVAFKNKTVGVSDSDANTKLNNALSNPECILLYSAILFFWLRSVFGFVEFLALGSFFGICIFLIKSLNIYTLNFTVASFIALLLFFIGYVILFLNNTFSFGLSFLPQVIGALGVSWSIYTKGIGKRFILLLTLFSFFLFFFGIFGLGLKEGEIFANSRNHVSVLFLNLTILFLISTRYENRLNQKYTITFLVFTTFFASIVAVGISGVLSSLILLTMILYYQSTLKQNYIMYISSLLLIILAIYFWEVLIQSGYLHKELIGKIDFELLISENMRYTIWSEYIKSIDLIRFFTGANLGEEYAGFNNLHSSYLLLHARVGFIAFIFYFFFLLSLIKLFTLDKVLFSGLLVLLIRAFSDTTFLSGSPFDFVFFYLVFFAPYRNNIVVPSLRKPERSLV